MANRTKNNPIVLDTFGADVELTPRGVPLNINKIVLYSAAAGDLLTLIDAAGNKILTLSQWADGGSTTEDFNPQRFVDGVTFDTSASTGLGSGDLVYIYLA
jgi:hypothetical protein